MADQSEPTSEKLHPHVKALATFLAKFRCKAINKDHFICGIERTFHLIDQSELYVAKPGSTRSRYNTARSNLHIIRKRFGDEVFNLCLVAIGPTPLSTFKSSGFDTALAKWPEIHTIPTELAAEVQKAIVEHRARKKDGRVSSDVMSNSKRRRSVLDEGDQGTTDDHGNGSKRSRVEQSSDLGVISPGEMIVRSSQDQVNQQPPTSFRNSALAMRVDGNDGASHQGSFADQRGQEGAGDFRFSHAEPEVDALSSVKAQGVSRDAIVDNSDGDDSDDSDDRDEEAEGYLPSYSSMPQVTHHPILQDGHVTMPRTEQYAPATDFNLIQLENSYGYKALQAYGGPVNLIMPLYDGTDPTISFPIPPKLAVDIMVEKRQRFL